MITIDHIHEAAKRIQSHVYRTPFELDPVLSKALDCSVYLKLELQQVSGSFKSRGAFNKILSIPENLRRETFFIAASTGNHAAAFCTVLQNLGLKGCVYLPNTVSPSKLSFIQAMGVPYELYGANSLQTELYARKLAEEEGHTLVHPYNDPMIIAGQGTAGLEIMQSNNPLDVIVVPVGGGGLIAGVSMFYKASHPRIHVVGCQPECSPEVVRSIEKGYIIREDISQPTLSDGTAGGLEPGSITFDICKRNVDEWALISEDEIADEIRYMLEHRQILIEGAAALPLAYCRKNRDALKGKRIALLITGKRIGYKRLKDLLVVNT